MGFNFLCIFAVCFLFHICALAQTDHSHLSSDPLVKRARILVQSRKFNEALAVLRPLKKSHPDQTDVLFLIGISAVGASEAAQTEKEKTALLDEAIAAFRKILINRPGLVRVRLELARAFFLKGDDDLSRKHFESVLAGKPPAAVAANVRRFLNVIRERRRWNAYFGFTLAPDTNINSQSDEEIIWLNIAGQLLPFRREGDFGAKSGIGVLLWGGAEYQQPLGNGTKLRIGTDISRREYDNKQFDQTLFAAHIGPRYLPDANTEMSLLAVFRHRWIARKRYNSELGARFEIARRISRRVQARAQAQWLRREYRRNEILNGPVAAFSLGALWFAAPILRTELTLGYTVDRPKSEIWRNSALLGKAGFSVALPLGFSIGGSGEFHRINYKRPYFSSGNRKDSLRIFNISVFNRAFTILGFSPQIVLVNERRKSNSQLQEYKRNRAELRFVRQF